MKKQILLDEAVVQQLLAYLDRLRMYEYRHNGVNAICEEIDAMANLLLGKLGGNGNEQF